jgi:hypothetical protein
MINKGDVLYYAQMMPTIPLFEVIEVKVRTVEDTWFVGMDKRSKHAYYFNNDDVNKIVFKNRKECLDIVLEAEAKCKKKKGTETFYEEY